MYILVSEKNNRFYIGCTQNREERLKKHNNGDVSSTKHYRPWKLIYFENYNNLSEARKRELQIKSWKKRVAIEKLISNATIVADPR